jgi:hypothetical protein
VSYGSEPRLPAEVDSGTATCPMALNLASRLRWALELPRVALDLASRLRWTSARPRVYGPLSSSIKKPIRPACAARQAYFQRTHVFKVSDVRAIMGLQDVRAGNIVNTCKTDRHAGTVQCRHYRPLVWHRYSAKQLNSMASHC